jgi:hypothetical protein
MVAVRRRVWPRLASGSVQKLIKALDGVIGEPSLRVEVVEFRMS